METDTALKEKGSVGKHAEWDDSGRGRKRESNRKKMQHSDRYSEICPTRWRHVLANFWYTWQGVMT